MVESHRLNLSNLPPDIIRKIIRANAVPAANIQLISRSWNLLFAEFHRNRKILPPIENCHIFLSGQNDKLKILITIQRQYFQHFAKCFGARYWKERPTYLNGCTAMRARMLITSKITDNIYSDIFAELFMRSSRVRVLTINNVGERVLGIIQSALKKEIVVDILSIRAPHFDYNLRNITLDLAKRHTFDELYLFIEYTAVNTDIIRAFLLEIPSLTPSFYLQQEVLGKNVHPIILFHERGDVWDRIAEEMIEKGIMSVKMCCGLRVVTERLSHLRLIMHHLDI